MKHILVLLVLVLSTREGVAVELPRNLIVKQYTTADGLPSNRINAMAQDSRGFMWVASENGLARVTKEQITPIRDLYPYIPAKEVVSVKTSDHGNVIFKVNNVGYYDYDYLRDTVTYLSSIRTLQKGKKIHWRNHVQFLGEKLVVLSPKGIMYAESTTGGFIELSDKVNCLKSELVEGVGLIIFGKRKVYLLDYELNLKELADADSRFQNHRISVCVANSSYIYLMNSSEIVRFDYETGEYEDVYDLVEKGRLYTMVWWKGNSLILHTSFGVLRFNLTSKSLMPLDHNPNLELLYDVPIKMFQKDRNGNVWVGTWRHGIYVIEADQSALSIVTTKTKLKLGQQKRNIPDIKGVYADGDRIVIYAFNKIRVLDINTYEELQVLDLASLGIQAVIGRVKRLNDSEFIASLPKGLLIWNTKLNTTRLVSVEHNNRVDAILVLDDHTVLYAAGFGVYRLDLDAKEVKSEKVQNPEQKWAWVNNIYRCEKEQAWILTRTGIRKYFAKENAIRNVIDRDSLLVSGDFLTVNELNGKLWLGDKNSGVIVYDPNTNIAEKINLKVFEGGVYGIEFSGDTLAWVATRRDVYALNTQNYKVKKHRKENVHTTFRFKVAGHTKDKNGMIYLVSPSVVYLIDPMQDTLTNVKISRDKKVYFTEVYADGERLNKNISGKTGRGKIELDKISLLEIDFSMADFIQGGQSYSYKMEGFDDYWKTTCEGRANYTKMPPGNYTFKVRLKETSLSQEGGVSELEFVVLPAWYETWWFRFVLAVIIAASIVLYVRLKMRAAHINEVILKNTISERTEEIQNKNEELSIQKERIQVQLEELQTYNDALNDLTENLEHKVKERTEMLAKQNQALRDLAFFNSHEVRRPLANIVALVEIINDESLDRSEVTTFIETLKKETLAMDEKVKAAQRKLDSKT